MWFNAGYYHSYSINKLFKLRKSWRWPHVSRSLLYLMFTSGSQSAYSSWESCRFLSMKEKAWNEFSFIWIEGRKSHSWYTITLTCFKILVIIEEISAPHSPSDQMTEPTAVANAPNKTSITRWTIVRRFASIFGSIP